MFSFQGTCLSLSAVTRIYFISFCRTSQHFIFLCFDCFCFVLTPASKATRNNVTRPQIKYKLFFKRNYKVFISTSNPSNISLKWFISRPGKTTCISSRYRCVRAIHLFRIMYGLPLTEAMPSLMTIIELSDKQLIPAANIERTAARAAVLSLEFEVYPRSLANSSSSSMTVTPSSRALVNLLPALSPAMT